MLFRSLTLLCVIAICYSSYSPFLPTLSDYLMSRDQVKRYFFTESRAYVAGTCPSVPFASAQSGFASGVGLPADTTWRNADLLTNATITMIDSGIDGLAAVCGIRQQFVQTLGQAYDTCIDRFYLLSLGGSDFWNIMTYTHLMKHLEFICSTGFDVYQRNIDCIRKGETTDGNLYKACFYKFNRTVETNPNRFCDATETFVTCIKDFFTEECNPWVGWMQCELERVGFAYDCFNIYC
ncbi:unnamed protein product [Caenorhabditis bovis]|uniref:DUF19 domain-containing protein n=1 Tax=Caenorhabditis bovis TaxID=2654633 RepID=A0A8S1ERZ3_9PELO|nr:unnamed protein product [Caenorhabditis bovis]